MFLGANMDAIGEARRFGIKAHMAAEYLSDEVGTALNYEAVNEVMCNVRACKAMTDSWKKNIEEDVAKRRRR
jgi:hypothetical protein